MGIFGKKEKSELYKLQEKYDTLKKRYESSCVSYDELKDENNKLQCIIAYLGDKNKSEADKSKAYQEQIETLQAECEKLQSTIALLNEKLHEKLDDLKSESKPKQKIVLDDSNFDLYETSLFPYSPRFTSLELQIARLNYFADRSNKMKTIVNNRIERCEKGLVCENITENILLSFSPESRLMRDICFTLNGTFYQIDFLLITPTLIFVIDSKSSYSEESKHSEEAKKNLRRQEEVLKSIIENSGLENTADILMRFNRMLVYANAYDSDDISNCDSAVDDKSESTERLKESLLRLNKANSKSFEKLLPYQINSIAECIYDFCILNPQKRICPVCGKGELCYRNNNSFLGCSNYYPERDDSCRYTENLNIEKELLPYLQKENS